LQRDIQKEHLSVLLKEYYKLIWKENWMKFNKIMWIKISNKFILINLN
jgi:hypothetical protein